MKKRSLLIVSVILLVSLLSSMLCVSVSAAGETEISTADQLKAVANNLSGSYKLTADIDLGGEAWTPIGNSDTPFTGTFDGNGHTVSNFTITADETYGKNSAGFFGYSNGGTIKNLRIANATITTSYSAYVGAVLGYQLSEVAGRISSCVVASDVTLIADGAHCEQLKIGGIVGESRYLLEYCENNATVTVKKSINGNPDDLDSSGKQRYTNKCYAGGIAGTAIGTVKYCINNGNVTVEDYDGKKSGWYTFAAGVLGGTNPWGELTSVIQGCINNGTITNSISSLNVTAGAGGVVGNTYGGNAAFTARTVKDCFNFGDVESNEVGQIIGHCGNSDPHKGAVTCENNVGIANHDPMCGNISDDLLLSATNQVGVRGDTAENMKASDTYKNIITMMENNMLFDLSDMPAPATPANPPSTDDTNNNDSSGEDDETTDNEDETTKAPVTTEAPTADSTPTTDAADEANGGCGSTVSAFGALAILSILGTAVICKKKD